MTPAEAVTVFDAGMVAGLAIASIAYGVRVLWRTVRQFLT